jgi:hypothetical protein
MGRRNFRLVVPSKEKVGGLVGRVKEQIPGHCCPDADHEPTAVRELYQYRIEIMKNGTSRNV